MNLMKYTHYDNPFKEALRKTIDQLTTFAAVVSAVAFMIILPAISIGGGVYMGEVWSYRTIHAMQLAEIKKADDDFLKWQQDLIHQYEKDNPGSKPSTKDFPSQDGSSGKGSLTDSSKNGGSL